MEKEQIYNIIRNGNFNDSFTRNLVETVMLNSLRQLNIDSGISESHNNETLTQLAEIIRDVFSDLEIRKLIGVQPLHGPVGEITRLQDKNDNINRYAVEARSRKCRVKWIKSEDFDQPKGNDHVTEDIETLVENSLVSEINLEIACELFKFMLDAALQNNVPEVNDINSLKDVIYKTRQEIKDSTGKDLGNWLVVSEGSKFSEELTGSNKKGSNLLEKTISIDGMNVFLTSDILLPPNTILIGYKGTQENQFASEEDAGLIYAPYIMMVVGYGGNANFVMRYALHSDSETPKYYRIIKVK